LAWIIVRRARSLQRAMLLLNLIFIVCLGLDGVLLTATYIHPPANKFSIFSSAQPVPAIPRTDKPDIYLLIFDEYGSSLSLQQNYGYHNDLDAWLLQQGFRVQTQSFSNYNYTPASVASILNMSFIKGIKDSTLLTGKDMNYCLQLTRDNKVIDFLSREGYEIVNCSFFDLAKKPTIVEDPLLPVRTKLITANTLWSKISSDLGWMFYFGPLRISWLADKGTYTTQQFNARLLQMIKTQSSKKQSHPVFVYGHLFMPHDPYFYDKNGHLKSEQTLRQEVKRPAGPYLEYLTYVNAEIRKLIDTIQQNTQRKAAIVLMGDHGYRRLIEQNLHCNYQNLNAVYLPSQDYHLFYDSVSAVNQFKIVFNSLFQQSIPLLKDSTIFLTGKQ
ncbi:MAG TPA: sulfatase-like hydrolase/transferase, partial [Chitinophagaceae bacterium]|nr:sulfatase-like hydrolase/transferase [Chitinophagaceae bacterium]